MDNVTVYAETVYNSSNSTNLTRNLNKNRKKSNVIFGIILPVADLRGVRYSASILFRFTAALLTKWVIL